MTRPLCIVLGLLVAGPAFAAPTADLRTTITGPAAVDVDQAGTYTVTVRNAGTKDASGVVVYVQLPETNTSPGVYVMGTVGTLPGGCARSGTLITCTVGTLRKSRSSAYAIPVAFPLADQDLVIDVDAWTSTTESSTSNNTSSLTADPLPVDVVDFTGAGDMTNAHCTGTGLTSYFECELYPSSISSHTVTFALDGSISIAGYPDYGGSWESDAPDHLVFTYTELGSPVATFEGWGVDDGCFEGLTTFIPDNGYVSPYRVCVP